MAADFTEFDASGLRWRAETAHADVVRREVAERLAAIDGGKDVTVLKRNLVRAVLRVPLAGGGRVIVKRYAVGGLLDWVKYTFRQSRAAAEWTVGRGLDDAGVPTAVPLAMAERRRFVLRDAALVTREITDALHLNAYVEANVAAPGDARRGALYDDLARVVRRMHDAGFVHNDLHGGNILVNGPPDARHLYVIDLHSVTRRARPAESARWFDLVKLLHSMLNCSTVAERERICRVYEETGGASGTRVAPLLASGRLSAALEPQLVRMELRRVKSRTARALTRSSKFDVSHTGGLTFHHLRTVPAGDVARLISSHAATMAAGRGQVLKDATRSALTRQTLQAADGPRSVIVKQYRSDALGERLKNAVRRPRALAAWLAGNGLLVRNFDAAEPLAMAMRGRGLFLSDAYLVMEDLGEDRRLDLVALARFAGDLDAAARREKRALVAAVADLFRTLHASGVYHGDTKAVNLFLRETPDGPRVAIADYDRVEFDTDVPVRRRVKNLAQLSASVAVCISLTDRLRFFREYSKDDPSVAAAWKDWFRRVEADCRRKIVVRMNPIE